MTKLMRMLKEIADRKSWGQILIKIQNGKIVLIEKSETFKID
jgi:hypothetical protein